jgi:hypothetical protein
MEFWSDVMIDRSFKILQELRRKFEFVLIGGWAVYFYTGATKSKDIDLIVDFENLSKIKSDLEIKKNAFLRKYEAELEGVSVDIYVPYYSEFAIPVEEIMKNTLTVENFRIPRPEVLLILKQQAEMQRKDAVKGQKDRVDIISLAKSGKISWKRYGQLVRKFDLRDYAERLKGIIRSARVEFEYLGILNPREMRKMREKMLKEMG